MKLFLVLLFSFPIFAFCQINLKGIVVDSINDQPIPYATVFINGTTNGTITDSIGKFVINNISIPAEVIVSHATYSTKMVYIESSHPNRLDIELNSKNIELPKVSVADKSMRQNNVEEFKRLFLGTDHLGKKAILVNENSLFFNRHYTQKKIFVTDTIRNDIKYGAIKKEDIISWSADSSNIMVQEQNFEVLATAPLIIDMPELGYKLQVDLVDFIAQYNGDDVQIIFRGYYYFKPYKTNSKSKTKKYEKRRQTAYYNSSQHFCRSLFSNTLKENGYKIEGKLVYELENLGKDNFVNIEPYLKRGDNNTKQIIGLKNKYLTVVYHRKFNGRPVDLSQKKRFSN